MLSQGNAACRAAVETYVLENCRHANRYVNIICGTFVIAIFLSFVVMSSSAEAGLRRPAGTPLKQFGFAAGTERDTATEIQKLYNVTKRVVGSGGIIRTGLNWDPSIYNVPDFRTWSATKLQPAIDRGLIVLPCLGTHGPGGSRIPTDAQWTEGLRMIVRMYGPGGIYARGGTYRRNGYTVSVPAHPNFRGLTDFELWNEPDSRGNVHGTMTSAKIAHLLRIGSVAMREEAAKLGFRINIVGPGFEGMEVADVQKLWMADNTIFKYIDTLSVHAYSRMSVSTCNPDVEKKRCIRNLERIRAFLDTHGGRDVRLANTEGGYAGATGTCLGPQVLPEQVQAEYSEEALRWIRNRPNLNVDFWLTFHPIDRRVTYKYDCDSNTYDPNFWQWKLGVVRADFSLKPWGARLNTLANNWK